MYNQVVGRSDSGMVIRLERSFGGKVRFALEDIWYSIKLGKHYGRYHNAPSFLVLDVDEVGAHKLMQQYIPKYHETVGSDGEFQCEDYSIDIVTSEISGLWGCHIWQRNYHLLRPQTRELVSRWLYEFVFGNI